MISALVGAAGQTKTDGQRQTPPEMSDFVASRIDLTERECYNFIKMAKRLAQLAKKRGR